MYVGYKIYLSKQSPTPLHWFDNIELRIEAQSAVANAAVSFAALTLAFVFAF